MRFIVDTEIEEWVSRRPNSDDPWDIGDLDGHLNDVFIRRAAQWEEEEEWYGQLERPSYLLPEELSEPGTTIYVVAACYSSGCTFGRTGVSAAIMGVYPTDERDAAYAAADALEGATSGTPWSGYFESLELVNVYPLTV